MELDDYKKLIDSISDENSIYLLEALSKETGFFSSKKKLMFITKDETNYAYEGIETEYLRLQTHIRISSVKNNQSFDDDDYNLIIYKGELSDENSEAFIRLCKIYANKVDELDFKEFFYSLISLFQLTSEQKYKNAIGLYGELKFMLYARDVYKKDISHSWHKRGSKSQYDFSNGECSIEVKCTSTSEPGVTVKHDQIFDNHECYLCAVICEPYDNGETIEEIVQKMEQDPVNFCSLDFSINIAKELKRISPNDIKNLRFEVKEIRLLNTKDINPFPDVPENVNKLTYVMDLSDCKEMEHDEEEKIIQEF